MNTRWNPSVCLRGAVLSLTLVACGGDDSPPAGGAGAGYALTQGSPYPEHLTPGSHVRTLVVRSEDRTGTGPTRAGTTCYLTTLLFDVPGQSPLAPTTIDTASGCNLYTAMAPESQYANQRWICAGAITLTSTGGTQNVGACPDGSHAPATDNPIPCAVVTPSGLMVTAVDNGIPGAVLTDLSATISLPSPVSITAPSDLASVTWPATGDLRVSWTSSGATSAVVRLDAQGAGGTAVIVCTPHTNGSVVIPAAMVNQASLRMRDARVTVTSVRDTMVTAEGGKPYRVSGATATSVILQALH